MKILRKTHFWQDKRTYFEVDAEPPTTNERGYAEEGSVNIRIGDEEGIKAAFKLSADEARAVVDVLKLFLEKHDTQMARLFSSREEDRETTRVEPASFTMFDAEKEDKPKLQFYY
jgi:hypothetical protein